MTGTGARFKMANLDALEGVAILTTLGISARTRVKTRLFGLFRPKQRSRCPPCIGGHLERFRSQTTAGIGRLEVAAGEGQITSDRYFRGRRAAGWHVEQSPLSVVFISRRAAKRSRMKLDSMTRGG